MQPVDTQGPALRFRGVTKRYGRKTALDGLDLHIPRGSIFGLVGANGAGKTTFMSIAAGLLHVDEGAIDLLGRGPYDPVRHRGRVTLLPQDALPPPYARVHSLLEYYARLQGMSGTEARKATGDVLAWVNLADRRRASIRSLSHGMRRRFSIAQAFLGHPELVILDEPMNGLDPTQVASLRSLIASRSGEQTVVISSHILPDLETLCDHIAIVHEGKLVRQGSLAEITRRGAEVIFHLTREPETAALQARHPEWAMEWNAPAASLRVLLPPDIDPAQANDGLIRALLDQGCGILEITRGSSLEEAYLSSQPADAAPAQ